MPLPRQLLLGNGVLKRGPVGPAMVFFMFSNKFGFCVDSEYMIDGGKLFAPQLLCSIL